ncbi:hypothetical protein AX14_004742 [Amanita brunnescens Koide BX004]|nr:hypothetical protein AX14_004742 [Amanita brunnescens Koide BX004]
MLLLLFFFLVPSLVSGDVGGMMEYEPPPTFPERRFAGNWYRVLHSPQQKCLDDVAKIDNFGYAQFGRLAADYSKPPTFPEVEDELTDENEKRIQDIWRRMPSARVSLENRLTQMTVVDTRRPEVTDPKVILPSGASFSPLPGDAATLTETNYEGTWYRVIRGNTEVGQDYNVIDLRHGQKPRLGGISWMGTINWKAKETVTNNHLLGGWLLWPHPSRTDPRDLLLFYVQEGKLHDKLTSTQLYIQRRDPVKQDPTLPVPVPNKPPVQQSRRPPSRRIQPPPPLPQRPVTPPSRLSKFKKMLFG